MRVRTWFNQPARAERRHNTRVAKAAKVFPRPITTLKPIVRCPTVRYNIKSREGKGFTLEEIKAAKISVNYARSVGISVDLRRTNLSKQSLELNSQRLKEYMSKLVVFPVNGRKPTKTEATKEQQEAAVQNLNVLPYTAPVVTEAPRKVTEEEKKFKAYTTLRATWAKAKYCGIRLKAKAKKAEKKD
ncbi:S60 ribosomal protein L13 [Cavenderia fasciculata]|uniref:S60 ribosomal protein L13 n=1 Tax=Cavenderia fasciculata TaxID=261658 RepID=F4PW36_CACFS|nr:S60 ribosomal protein L13 [Cavenderia fasciculata]EGG20200.1 S60 ribosomal protein L13 [Cavenderia fasciculata]|eukprot:XP_004367183.1 S60 ribosomal protein L13 [Cavenderia fasciculata]